MLMTDFYKEQARNFYPYSSPLPFTHARTVFNNELVHQRHVSVQNITRRFVDSRKATMPNISNSRDSTGSVSIITSARPNDDTTEEVCVHVVQSNALSAFKTIGEIFFSVHNGRRHACPPVPVAMSSAPEENPLSRRNPATCCRNSVLLYATTQLVRSCRYEANTTIFVWWCCH